MRHLREQLLELLELARQQHRMEPMPKRLLAVLTRDLLDLLPGGRSRVAMHSRTLSRGNLHRHIFTIRCPDQAFYLDAIRGYLQRKDIQPISQQTLVARMECDDNGCQLELRRPDTRDEKNFMYIALHISATITPDIKPLERDIQAILKAVELSVNDFQPMRRFIARSVAAVMADDADAAALLDWMNDNHFLFFGIEHQGERLGLMRNRRVMTQIAPDLQAEIEACAAPEKPGMSWLNLSATANYLYSAANVEVVRLAWRGENNSIDQAMIIGHFSRSARYANGSYLPLLANHWRALASDPLLQNSSFYRRELRTIFDRMPKRILLASKIDSWFEPFKAIIDLAGPMQLVARRIACCEGDMDTLMIAISAKRFGPQVLHHICRELEDAGMQTHGHETFGIGQLRITLIGIDHDSPQLSQKALDDLIRRCIVFWKDLARSEVLRHADTLDIPATLKELMDIPPLYQELFPPAQFTRDLKMRSKVLNSGKSRVYISLHHNGEQEAVALHLYSMQQPSLGTLVDIIRAFGLDPAEESVLPFGPDAEQRIYISALICRSERHLDIDDVHRLRRAIADVLNGSADHDPINALVIAAGLDIDQIALLITLRNHLIQLLPDAAKLPLSEMMIRHPAVSAALHKLFASRHLQAMPDSYQDESRRDFFEALSAVASLADDRWFRALAELAEASLRTNAFVRKQGSPIGIKIDPARLSFVGESAPYREIFVHGVHVEGIHLRAGPIARGGLRFSDRPSDFRTEVLELMRTQVVKNGQIVPTGAKGGFVVRDGEGAEFVLQQYRLFIDTLLALTDNLIEGECVAPEGVRIDAHDRDDSYLVVAADKGTARYSDDANARALHAGFWLGDAFASGGRYGYDHKAVGITARGAWVCAVHHFAKMGIDANRDPISCVAIGDMGGDVFGNGMLLNPELKLLAAFNHRHIFLDPEPDAAAAFAERKRLFAKVAGWEQYNSKLISAGGGVFERSAKQIPLAASVRKALGIEAEQLSGEALIRAILSAPVDLLYNGGIGTYIKAGSESHADVRDPANNSVRIDAEQLRCRVVCEGGNLGLTQRSRIEYALGGGIINTDAMDNSAGVDMSDHEVNLKILLSPQSGREIGFKERNTLLKSMTEAVTVQCLDDNRLQSRALTLAEANAVEHPMRLQRLRNRLIDEGLLNDAIAPRIREDELLHLRPQLSILLGQEKNRIHEALSSEQFHSQCAFSTDLLQAYFPAAITRRFGKNFSLHPLADEIIHTSATNHIVNHFGITAVHDLQSIIDHPIGEIVEALMISEKLLDGAMLREAIWERVTPSSQAIVLQQQLQEQIIRFAEELLRLCPIRKIDSDWIKRQHSGLDRFRSQLGSEPEVVAAMQQLESYELHDAERMRLATMPIMVFSSCGIHLSAAMHLPLARVLTASQLVLELLPLLKMEQQLRSHDWSTAEAHALRREWLHRLIKLKEMAIRKLLEQHNGSPREHAIRLWHSHPLWAKLERYIAASEGEGAEEDRRAETRRMRLLLALSQLESIIEQS